MRKGIVLLLLISSLFFVGAQSASDYLEMGKSALKNNEPQDAVDYWNKSIAIFEKENNTKKIKSVLYLLADLYNSLQLYNDEIKSYKKILYLIQIQNSQEEADCFFSIASGYKKIHDLETARLFFEKSLSVNRALRNKVNMAKSLYEIGNIYTNTGKYQEALAYFNGAIRNLKKGQDELLKVIVYKQIAKIYMYKGDYAKAVACLEDEFILIYRQKNYIELADYFNIIGKIKILQGKFDTGMKFYQVALSYLEKLDDKTIVSDQLLRIGNCYLKNKKYNEAIASFTNSYIVNSTMNDKIRLAYDVENIARVYETMQEYKYALRYYNQSLIFNWEKANKGAIVTNSLELGRVYYKLGIYKVAIEHFEEGCNVVGNEIKRDGDNAPVGVLDELHRYLISAYIKNANPKMAFAAALKNAIYPDEIKLRLNGEEASVGDIDNLLEPNMAIICFFRSDENNIAKFVVTKGNIEAMDYNDNILLSSFNNKGLNNPIYFFKKNMADLDKITLVINYYNYLLSIASLSKAQREDCEYISNIFYSFFLKDVSLFFDKKYKIIFICDRYFTQMPFRALFQNK